MLSLTLVLVDFDGTLTRHDTFPLFIHFVLGKRFFVWLPAIIWHVFLMKAGLLSAQKTKERILALALRGWERGKVQQAGRAFIARLFENEKASFRPGALDRIRRHREAESRVFVVSASPEEWVVPFAEALGIECIATRLEYNEQGFTGKFAGKNCTGDEKVRRIKALIPDISAYYIEAYGDSPGDFFMLNMAHQAFYKPFQENEHI